VSGAELLEQARRLGARFSVPQRGTLHVKASGPLPDELLAALRQYKGEILQLLTTHSEASSWPVPDAQELLARWEALGCPQIPLSPGVSISNLRKWINSHIPGQLCEEHLTVVRQFLWEGLPPTEVPPADPLLEKWRRVSIPQWQRILQESVHQGDSRREEYARWMLEEILVDPDYTEDQL
jgi:hypothetical protein